MGKTISTGSIFIALGLAGCAGAPDMATIAVQPPPGTMGHIEMWPGSSMRGPITFRSDDGSVFNQMPAGGLISVGAN